MGFYEKNILPYCIEWLMSAERFSILRKQSLEGVQGTVLEVGFGSGLNLPHYPPAVTHLYALDPSLLGRRLAEDRIRAAPFPVEFAELEGVGIDLPDHSVDVAVSTWTLCTIPDVGSALREMRRVLRPDGRFIFLEHGLSPEPSVARLQNFWNPMQKMIGGGCHVNRKIDQVIRSAGWRITEQDNFYMDPPKFLAYMFRGVAEPE